MQRVIKFDRKDWIKSYIDTNTDLMKKLKMNLKNMFFVSYNKRFSLKKLLAIKIKNTDFHE